MPTGAEVHHHLGNRRAKNGFSTDAHRIAATVRRPLRRALQRYVEDPLSEALIAGQITARPAFLEVYLEANQFVLPADTADETTAEEKPAGILLFSA